MQSATMPRQGGRSPERHQLIAGRFARLIGGYLDVLLVSAFFAVSNAHPSTSPLWPVICWALFVVPSTAASGRTLGKLAVGTRVVELSTLRPPTMANSLLRWAVLAGPSILLVAATHDARWRFATFATLIVVAPILWDVLRRGVHDRAAGTIVIRTR